MNRNTSFLSEVDPSLHLLSDRFDKWVLEETIHYFEIEGWEYDSYFLKEAEGDDDEKQ